MWCNLRGMERSSESEKKILSTLFMCLNFNHYGITLVVSLRRMGLKVSLDVEGKGGEKRVEKG